MCLQEVFSPSAMNSNTSGFDSSESISNYFNKIFLS